MQLKIIANHNSKGALNSIKEVEVVHPYNSLYTNIYKQSIALFLAEVLSLSIREEEANISLYKYLELSFLWLDSTTNFANFHLLFLLNLTKYLGFYPELENNHYTYFDLIEGKYVNSTPKYNYISGHNLAQFNKLLGINFDALETVKINSENRRQILTDLIQYYELHLSGFRKLKSLEVLKSLFS